MTTADEFWLKDRTAGHKEALWVGHYWLSAMFPHRDVVIEAVRSCAANVNHVLEVGCHCGPNVARLAEVFPEARFTGFDYSLPAVLGGRKLMRAMDLDDRVRLLHGRVPECLRDMPSGSVDIALSVYTAAYLDPTEFRTALAELFRISAWTVFVEPGGDGRKEDGEPCQEWRHDFSAVVELAAKDGRMARVGTLSPAQRGLDTVCIIGPRAHH